MWARRGRYCHPQQKVISHGFALKVHLAVLVVAGDETEIAGSPTDVADDNLLHSP